MSSRYRILIACLTLAAVSLAGWVHDTWIVTGLSAAMALLIWALTDRRASANAAVLHAERARLQASLDTVRQGPPAPGGGAAEARLAHMASHDALTGLPNRLMLVEHMRNSLAARSCSGETLAVLCLDLDRFRLVNDTLGHPAGDALLRLVAERLRRCTRETDLVVRLGGDEFAILQQDAKQPGDATILARRLIDALTTPFEIEGQPVVIGTTIGIAVATQALDETEQLLKCADIALDRAKSDGRGSVRFFEPGMDAQMQVRRALEMDLRRAMSAGEFELFYQPLVEAGGGAISGFEALLRWRHPERGLVPPAAFIPLAEDVGLIGPIGAWVLRQACTEAMSWPGALKVAVNLSPAQFRGRDLAAEVAAVLAATGLPAGRLELEITEALLLQRDDGVLETLHALRALGLHIAMDDFGTGYSSLSYLQRFPFDKIKIDQSFIEGIAEREDCQAIVRAIIGLGQSLGIAVNAEGVETTEQLSALRAEGCGELQGFLFSKPKPACEVIDMLRQHGNATLPGADLGERTSRVWRGEAELASRAG